MAERHTVTERELNEWLCRPTTAKPVSSMKKPQPYGIGNAGRAFAASVSRLASAMEKGAPELAQDTEKSALDGARVTRIETLAMAMAKADHIASHCAIADWGDLSEGRRDTLRRYAEAALDQFIYDQKRIENLEGWQRARLERHDQMNSEIERLRIALRSVSQLLSYGVNTQRHNEAKIIADSTLQNETT